MTTKNLKIHSENILPIIKRWLYSDKDIFIRELVSNSCDAINKCKLLIEQGSVDAKDSEFRIDIKINKEAKTLSISDNGIGMDEEEVDRYISQIAFSSAEEFLDKYKSEKEGDQIIGHFGLGFYSSYMVANQVDLQTLSYKESAMPVLWTCGTTTEYEISKGNRSSRGTEVILHISDENKEYLEETKIREILKHYCSFMSCPVYLEDKQINTHEPLWMKAPSECTDQEYLEFYRYLYPMQEDPLFWVHLNVDYPFNLKGILFFPKIKRDLDINKTTIKLFCNRVFVSDNCKDVIPNYLMMLQGVIDSPDIPLNVSRSSLQMDSTVRKLSGHISKKVSDSLTSLYRSDKEKFYQSWKDISTIIKLGALEDEKFYERVKDLLLWKVVDGEWVTAADYIERNKEKAKDKVFYTLDESHSIPFLEMYKKRGIEVLLANSPIDSYLMQFLEQKLTPTRFQRIDGGIDETLLDKEKEKTVLDADGKTDASKLADFIRSKLGEQNIEVEAKSLDSVDIPGVVIMDEEMRRMRDYFISMGQEGGFEQIQKRTFVVNTNHPIMGALQKINERNPKLADDLVREIYDLSLLSQREMDKNALNAFVHRSHQVLGELVQELVK
ncbi:MAG: molecular chaperone HtpG [Waddliaceae bacterium]